MSLVIRFACVICACLLFSACGGTSDSEFDSSPASLPDEQTVDVPEQTVAPAPGSSTPGSSAPGSSAPGAPTPNEAPLSDSDAPLTDTESAAPSTPATEPTPAPPAPTTQPDAATLPAPLAANVSWSIPSVRENGDPLALTDIGGYEIMYRKTSNPVFETVIIEDQTISDYVLENLDAGQYEVLIAVFDTEGLYSEFSAPSIVEL